MPSPDHPRLQTPWTASDRLIPRAVVQPVQRFVRTEAAGGVVLLLATITALAWANSPWAGSYERLWSIEAAIGVGSFELREDLRHWVNDGAMALFFFVVGLEIKRELVHGALRRPRVALVPVAGALGGMIAPALVYLALTANSPGANGWGIPMATDIAFALGALVLVGRRAPASLKAFLLALAIVDDVGAITVIAVFYSAGVSLAWLAGAGAGLAAVALLRRLTVRSPIPYAVAAVAVWFMTFESGVHATLAGVALGLLTPAWPSQHPRAVGEAARAGLARTELHDEIVDERDEATLLEVSDLTRQAVSPLARIEGHLHPWTAMVVLPLFALANAGIALTDPLTAEGTRVAAGVALGLLIGKPLGVLVAVALAVRFGGARLPAGLGPIELLAGGLLAGIGFTVSLFVTGLALAGELASAAKVGILGASVVAGAAGIALLALPAAKRSGAHETAATS